MPRMTFTVRAGNHVRRHCPVWVKAAGLDPARDYAVVSRESGAALPAQAVATPGGVRLAWIVPALVANASQTFTLEEGGKGSRMDSRFRGNDGPDSGPRGSDGVDARPRGNGGVDSRFHGNDAGVSVADGRYGLDVMLDGALFTTYHHAAAHNKLFLYPLIGPTGKGMTRGYPMVSDIPGEKHDHPHHKSIHVAHGDVNGVDLWSELDDHGYQRHESFLPAFGVGDAYVSGPVCGAFRSRSLWVSRAEQPVVTEEKHVVVYAPAPDARILDVSVTLRATEGPVRFGDTKEGAMLSVRVASSMDADDAGRYENAYGGTGEDECFGKRAQWLDYTGPVDGATVGLAVFDHPANFRAPTYWHVRDYGLVHANPFAWREFLGHPGLDGSYVLPESARLRCKFRVYLHTGNTQDAGVKERYHDFITPPAVEVSE